MLFSFHPTIPQAEADKRLTKKIVARAGTNITLPCIGLVGEKSVSKIEKLTWKSSQTIIKYISGRPFEQNQRVSCSSVKMDFFKKLSENFHNVHSTVAKYCWNYLFTHPHYTLLLSLVFQRSLNPKNFSLHFNPVKLIDSGEYACIVNEKPASGFINLAVQDVPQAPERPMITGFHSRWVNLSWTHNGDPKNDPVTHFVIQSR